MWTCVSENSTILSAGTYKHPACAGKHPCVRSLASMRHSASRVPITLATHNRW